MEHVLTGLDVMPAATHLTCSMLSSAHPSLAYGESQIHTMPYGIDGNRTHIGALDLLNSSHSYSLFATGESMGGMKSDSRSRHSVTIKDKSCDLVIMNPPFTRPTNHEASHAFSSGNAGLASNFMDLGHHKLKGVVALVVPFAFLRGKSWQSARQALKAHYSDIHVTSIAAPGSTARAFSADTGMAECLVVATKRSGGNSWAAYSNLAARPSSLLEAAVEAKNSRGRAVRGDILDAGVAGVRSTSVIEAARDLESGNLRLPRQVQAIKLPVVTLSTLAARGLVHRDINGGFTDRSGTGLARGPFIVRSIHPGKCRLTRCSGLIPPSGSASS